MELSKEKLRKKGWSPSEIKKTLEIAEIAKKNKHPFVKFLDSYIYWIVLLLTIFVNLFLAFTCLPYLLVLTSSILYPIIALFGFSFGLFFEVLINNLENLQKEHHLIISLVIPIYSIVFFFIIATLSNNLITRMRLSTPLHDPIIIGFVYGIVFIAPYFYYQFLKR